MCFCLARYVHTESPHVSGRNIHLTHGHLSSSAEPWFLIAARSYPLWSFLSEILVNSEGFNHIVAASNHIQLFYRATCIGCLSVVRAFVRDQNHSQEGKKNTKKEAASYEGVMMGVNAENRSFSFWEGWSVGALLQSKNNFPSCINEPKNFNLKQHNTHILFIGKSN